MKPLPPVPRRLLYGTILLGVLYMMLAVAYPPSPGGIKRDWGRAALQQARAIDLAMFSYCNDNDQKYPDGKSSTEVCQKLIDGGYVTDPAVFYLPLPGKTKGVGQKLKPDNICFDVTSSLEGNSPDELPVVFMTGYKVTYAPGGSAVPIIKPYPQFGIAPRTWSQWWNGEPQPPLILEPGIAVTYKNNNSKFLKLVTGPDGDGSISNFISPDFKPDGKTYRQLTPDGPLPP